MIVELQEGCSTVRATIEQSAAADCLQRPLLRRSRFRQRLSARVGLTRMRGGGSARLREVWGPS